MTSAAIAGRGWCTSAKNGRNATRSRRRRHPSGHRDPAHRRRRDGVDLAVDGAVDGAHLDHEPAHQRRERGRSPTAAARNTIRVGGHASAVCAPRPLGRHGAATGTAGTAASGRGRGPRPLLRTPSSSGVLSDLADDARRSPHLGLVHPERRRTRACPHGCPRRCGAGSGSNGIAFLFSAIPTSSQTRLGVAAGRSRSAGGRPGRGASRSRRRRAGAPRRERRRRARARSARSAAA